MGDRTLVQVFLETVERAPARDAAHYKRDGAWHAISWADLAARARRYAFGLVGLGLEPGDRVAILGNTRLEWVLAEFGVQMAGGISVAIYQSNPPDDVAYVLEDSGATLAFVEDDAQLAKLDAIAERVRPRRIVRLEGAGTDGVMSLDDLAALGDRVAADRPFVIDHRIAALRPEDPATFLYTSGTTGKPKGVILTHANWAFEAEAIEALGIVRPDDVQLLFLPLAHSFSQVLKTGWLSNGHLLVFAESMEKLVANLGEVRPTVMAAVPRVFEKVYAKIAATADEPGAKGAMFRWAMEQLDHYVEARLQGLDHHSVGFRLAKRLVFRKVQRKLEATFGDRLRFFISGGAPLAPRIAYFFEVVGVKILEGYGLTETSAATCVNRPERVKIGTVGPPVPGVELRIAEDGEILVRGGGVMKGYHDRPDATAEAIDADGWFHTGDVGAIDADGYLTITDRKKDLIKTAGGKYVAPQNLENELKAHPLISQALVHGDRRKYVTALLTVDEAAAKHLAEERGIPFTDLAAFVSDPRAHDAVGEVVEAVNARHASYETIKRFAVLDHDFTQENGELTPTLKIKRKLVERRYHDVLDGLYDS